MYHITIGLEIHIKLKSETKLFCQCANVQDFDVLEPNTHICPTCTWQPWALPVLSENALEKALLLWKALWCRIQDISSFDRKSYFYPDLPMGYQITQFYNATCVDGNMQFFSEDYEKEHTISIEQAHMETDTAKMIHDGGQALIDFNRAGTPLVEVVTWPDFSDDEQVVVFLKELQRIVRYNKISDADMDKGQMRVDVNISLRSSLDAPLWTRVEIKNMNSFSAIKRAIEYEHSRQSALYDAWESFTQETRWRNDEQGESYSMRSKEDALDYRYFPEPDLPSLHVGHYKDDVEKKDIILPFVVAKKLKEEYRFHKEYINFLLQDPVHISYFEELVGQWYDPLLVVKWLAWPIAAYMTSSYVSLDELPFDMSVFALFLESIWSYSLRDDQAKQVLDVLFETPQPAEQVIRELWFDAPAMEWNELETIAQSIIDQNPAVVQQYKEWKESTIGFFVWQMMKQTQGKSDPNQAKEIFVNLLK